MPHVALILVKIMCVRQSLRLVVLQTANSAAAAFNLHVRFSNARYYSPCNADSHPFASDAPVLALSLDPRRNQCCCLQNLLLNDSDALKQSRDSRKKTGMHPPQ